MNVRLRLIAGFVLIALFVLALFGLIAHRTALNVSLTQELSIQNSIVQGLAQTLGEQPVATPLPLKETKDTALVMTNKGGEILTTSLLYPDLKQALEGFPYKQLILDKQENGQQLHNKQSFIWTRATMPQNQQVLFLIYRENPDLPTYSVTLAKKLFVTAFVIIWVAIWVALVISKRIVRRLDEQNAALVRQALYDDLTDMPNRRQLHDMLEQCIQSIRQFTLLIVDLNNLRDINDTLGHEVGDDLIKVASQRLLKTVNNAKIVARLGGDEFAVIVETRSVDEAENIAREIVYQIGMPLPLSDIEIVTHASIGYAIFPSDAQDSNTLMKRAEVAMYRAKQERRSFLPYTPEIDPHSVQRLSLMASLRQAIIGNHLVAYYQPKVDLKTMRTTSVETLVRWHHPEQGIVPPDEFINLAERCDLIDKLTLWVIDESLRQCYEWNRQGLHLTIAVNLSARNLHDVTLPSQIGALLKKWQISSDQLNLEITESVLMSDPETAMETLLELDRMGLKLSVDDFGTGYSSLSYLKRLPISEIKIDRSFVTDMIQNSNDDIIVQSTIDLAHNMGFTVVAEGIEDQVTMDRLAALKCDRGQGFHISRPIPGDQFNQWLTESPWPPVTQ